MNAAHLEDVLPIYFSRLFPFEDLYEWLNYGEANTFACREFAFNFEGDRYLRYQAYSSLNDFKNDVKRKKPYKIDIGAVYNNPPSNYMREAEFYPVQKELIFDLDLTDYDEIRTCCSGTNVCSKCWKFMTIAIKILDTSLREDFGFDNILWTFSGRRGIHCWVCDKSARFLKKYGRLAVANYLQLVTGGEYKKKKVEINNAIHHSVQRALKIIEPLFVKICVIEQNMLGTQERIDKFLGIMDEALRTDVQHLLDKYQTSASRWQAFVEYFRNQIELKVDMWSKTPFLIEEIMIQYAYPRLDINVSLGISHLLKSPFSVHPRTGKIGIILDPKNIEHFDPCEVPTVTQLFKEIDVYDSTSVKQDIAVQNNQEKITDLMKTSLKTSLKLFRVFLSDLKKSQSMSNDT
ncbi:hypothetical protein TSAR_013891 [Trichomalopsis sarcophagae]|uniref:DNA primase n=1 Tax=Trichomalopsis sarcophagae TaxID=543379 RepID=A0A232FBU8_9HYME|nr:hypothetical protein TSAR_013891 [Trichomalopsis sarcophagae]